MRRTGLDGVALVTGGAGGLGQALCGQLGEAGMQVVTVDLPGRGADLAADVTDSDAMRAAVSGVLDAHGRLDVVIANAGLGVAGLAETISDDAWSRSLAVNVGGAVNTALAAYPSMIERKRGHLVIVASLAGLLPVPLMVPYATSKAALVAFATSLRPEAARYGVGVTVVCPGPIEGTFLDTGGWTGERPFGVDTRRYLTAAAGKALSADAVAAATLRGIRRNQAIVAPGRARTLAVAARLFPGLVDRIIARNMRKELALMKPATTRTGPPSA